MKCTLFIVLKNCEGTENCILSFSLFDQTVYVSKAQKENIEFKDYNTQSLNKNVYSKKRELLFLIN